MTDPTNDNPEAGSRREYRDGCLVDECVLTGAVKVGFLYRDPPEAAGPGETFGDSGWSIRGEAGDATDAELDARAVAYVPLDAVLAQDDSWLHLIDAPAGAANVRNPRTWKFEPADPSASD